MATAPPAAPASRKRILVVDDDPAIRLLCGKTLKNVGYFVIEAEGSSEAMTCYSGSAEPVDLLLTDLFLHPSDFQLSSHNNLYPRVNGHELVRQVLSLGYDLRVLLMSIHPFSNLASQGISIEPERFLQKPFSVEALLQQVAAALVAPPLHRKATTAASPAKDVQWFD